MCIRDRGTAASIAAARNGAKVTMVERYPYMGGLASGGMVLVLDDMTNGTEISVKGICQEFIDRTAKLGLALQPPAEDRRVQRGTAGRVQKGSEKREGPIVAAVGREASELGKMRGRGVVLGCVLALGLGACARFMRLR